MKRQEGVRKMIFGRLQAPVCRRLRGEVEAEKRHILEVFFYGGSQSYDAERNKREIGQNRSTARSHHVCIFLHNHDTSGEGQSEIQKTLSDPLFSL